MLIEGQIAPEDRAIRHLGKEAIRERLLRKSKPGFDGCRLWQVSLGRGGYGMFTYRIAGQGQFRPYAHRLSHWISIGPVPQGLQLDHLCRHTACIEVSHLEIVDAHTNVLRSTSGYALRTLCRQGIHDITDPSNYVLSGSERSCKACAHESKRRYRARRQGKDVPLFSELAAMGLAKSAAGGAYVVSAEGWALIEERMT